MIAPNPTASILSVVIPGVPVAWARAGTRHGQHFTPGKQRSWKHLAQGYMAQAMTGRPLFDAPLAMEIRAYWPRPKSLPKRLGSSELPRPSRPDSDNVAKQVCDAGIGVLYGDDAIVVELRVTKHVAAAGDGPRVEVVVAPWCPR